MTLKSLYARAEAESRALHAYELPEIVAFEAADMRLAVSGMGAERNQKGAEDLTIVASVIIVKEQFSKRGV